MSFHWIGKSADGKSVTLRHLDHCTFPTPEYATPEWIKQNEDIVRLGAVLDVETTGLSHATDVVIEIGLRQFLFNKNSGEILSLGHQYSAFQDPGRPLSSEIVNLTEITDEMVAGQNIDWDLVNKLLGESCIVIAHNARFDRPFLDKKSKNSNEKIWGCSYKQIDWDSKGFASPKLELLNIYHGFFTDSHRAINDVNALLYLLTHQDHQTGKNYLYEITQNAKRSMTQVIANSAPFESKDQLKSRGYGWDNTHRFWAKVIFKDDVKSEISWLENSVYYGPFAGLTRDIALNDVFK